MLIKLAIPKFEWQTRSRHSDRQIEPKTMKSKQFEIKTQCQYVRQSKLMCQLAIDSFNVINVINEDRQLHKYHDSFNVIND